MILAAVVGPLAALLMRPDALAGDLVLAAAFTVAALIVVAVLASIRSTPTLTPGAALEPFAHLRVRLRASDPAAAGHEQARAPGAGR